MLPIARPTPHLDAKSIPAPVLPGPKAGETAEDSTRREAASGIKPREAQLVNYLMARAAMHRMIDNTPDFGWKKDHSRLNRKGIPMVKRTGIRTDTLDRLRAGHQSVQEVSDLMPLGRANVREDIGKAKGEHTPLRNKATYELENALAAIQMDRRGTDLTDNDCYRMIAASGQYAKTGVCDNYSTSTTILHAAKLAGMKEEKAIVAQAQSETMRHTWSEMMPMGQDENGKLILHRDDVILDGWCKENLAILREDGQYSQLDKNGNAGHFKYNQPLNHESGPEALQEVERYKRQIAASQPLQQSFNSQFMHLVDTEYKLSEDFFWNAESVFHDGFRQKAGAALHKQAENPAPGTYIPIPDAHPVSRWAKHRSLAKIQAIGVARSLGSNFRGAIAEAPGIVASAKAMFPYQEPKSLLGHLSGFFRG